MSDGDECAYVYPSVPTCVCDIPRYRHGEDKKISHAFVEPAPQAESAPVLCEKHGREDCPRPDHDAAARAIVERHSLPTNISKRNVLAAVREAFTAGRALGRSEGVREEWEACMNVVSALFARRGKAAK